MAFEYNGVVYRDLEPQVRYDAEQIQLLKQADVTINENLQTVNESLQTVNTEINGKLTKPANPTAESAVTMLADGTVGTKPLSEIGGGKLYRHTISFDFEIEGVSINADIIKTSNSLISKSDFKSYIINPITCAVSGGGEGAARLQYSTVVNKYTVTGALLSKDPAQPKATYNIDISKRDIDYFTDTVTEV